MALQTGLVQLRLVANNAGLVQIMCEVGKSDIQDHVRMRLEAEKEEKEARRREKQEAHLYTVFRIVTDADIRDQIGHNRWFDLADQEKVRSSTSSCPDMPQHCMVTVPIPQTPQCQPRASRLPGSC